MMLRIYSTVRIICEQFGSKIRIFAVLRNFFFQAKQEVLQTDREYLLHVFFEVTRELESTNGIIFCPNCSGHVSYMQRKGCNGISLLKFRLKVSAPQMLGVKGTAGEGGK